MRERFVLLSTLLALAGPATAQSWPQFRGPDGRAHAEAPDLPAEFTLDDANWRVELPGRGLSSPAIHGDRIFLTSEKADESARVVQCLATENGRVLWERALAFAPYKAHRQNSFAASSPAVDGERVYLVWPDGETLVALAFDHDGEEVWHRPLGTYLAKHGGASSPILVGDVLVVANDNESPVSFLIGLDAATGERRWRHTRVSSRSAFATPILHVAEDGRSQVIFSSTSHGLTSLDPSTGELLWELDGIFEERCVASPVVAGQIVFATAGSGSGGKESAGVLLPKDGEDPRVRYHVRRNIPYVPSPVAVDDLLFLFSDGGIVSCIRAGIGKEVWRERVDGEFFGSPISVGQRLYAMTKDGRLVVLAASRFFQEPVYIDLGEPSNSTPAVADGVLYLRTDTHLISVGGRR